MKFKLINKPNEKLSATQQILYNRGIPLKDIPHYTNLSDQDINSPLLLGEDNLKNGLIMLLKTIKQSADALVIVDCDCDGYTSAAVLINYLYKLFPTWVQNHISFYMHDGKQHGLNDCIDYVLDWRPALVICPDASSNEYECHQRLLQENISVLVLDHHLVEKDNIVSENTVIINNQLSDYPNKFLSGVGVVWQFCRYIDSILKKDYADEFLDLVALGNCGDMMSLKSFETRYLITKGFKKENIKNPFIEYMIEKNEYPLQKTDYVPADQLTTACTSIGAAFFIVPFVNAITRSGTLEEKELIFKSMLTYAAFEEVLSNKRGHREGQKEKLIIQAIRTVSNVKNRQTRAEELGKETLEHIIESNHMLDHKILLFLLESNQINPEIRGLIANSFMTKYQRPCCILTRTNRENNTQAYEGSARGYTKTGIESFKQVLNSCPGINWTRGHDNAFGVSIKTECIDDFLSTADSLLKDVSVEPIYRIDYDFNEIDDNNDRILEIANMNDYWGQDIDRAFVNIKFKITNSNFKVMKNNTLKVEAMHGLSIIKFGAIDEEVERLSTEGYIELNAICKCNANKWGGDVFPQLIIQDYEIIDEMEYLF